MANWTNWSGSVSCEPASILAPGTEDGIRAAVAEAAGAGMNVRVAGTGHSFVPVCATDGLLLSLDNLQGLVSTNRGAGTATFWAGTKIWQMGEPLLQHGLALSNQGDIDKQAIAGALSTATHGTGKAIGNLSSMLAGARIVLDDGSLLDVSAESDPEAFRALRVSLGALGVLTQVTMRVLPAYRLYEKSWAESFDECLERMDERIAGNRHFEFWWAPPIDQCAMKTLNPTSEEIGPKESEPVSGLLKRYISPERVDWSYRIFPSERTNLFNEIEFSMPAENGPDCVRALRTMMQTVHPEVLWPIEYRTVAPDDAYISPHHGRPSVTISLHQAADLPHEPFFADAQAIMLEHGGRPHWGKWHTLGAKELERLYPEWDAFQSARKRLDPAGRFMNGHLRRLFE
jgi:FAD/FMN-containing dehydrogenase